MDGERGAKAPWTPFDIWCEAYEAQLRRADVLAAELESHGLGAITTTRRALEEAASFGESTAGAATSFTAGWARAMRAGASWVLPRPRS